MGITVCIVGIEGNLLNGFIRLVNMLACLKCMLVDGYTVCHRLHVKNELSLILLIQREMPVFGIVHDEVLVGIVVRKM